MKFIFERQEQKYLLSAQDYNVLIKAFEGYLKVDEYGETTIQSLYYDTPSYQLIRNSNEKPLFKQKLRLRAYGLISENDKSFLELKMKFDGTVFKRRIVIKEKDAIAFFDHSTPLPPSQIANEITYTNSFYGGLKPKMLMLYDRTAYIATDGSDLRITIDKNVRMRNYDLNLHTSLDGTIITPPNTYIMEIKSCYAIPLWLTTILSENKIYKTSFSKYGSAYNMLISQKKN